MTEYTTMVFEGSPKNLPKNLFKTETPFGTPVAISVGNVLADVDRMVARVEQLELYILDDIGDALPPEDSPND